MDEELIRSFGETGCDPRTAPDDVEVSTRLRLQILEMQIQDLGVLRLDAALDRAARRAAFPPRSGVRKARPYMRERE